jgi:hypothetical protein
MYFEYQMIDYNHDMNSYLIYVNIFKNFDERKLFQSFSHQTQYNNIVISSIHLKQYYSHIFI